MVVRPDSRLDRAQVDADLSPGELFLRYFAPGGTSTWRQVEPSLFGARLPTRQDHDFLAQALNGRVGELGGTRPVPYSGDSGDT